MKPQHKESGTGNPDGVAYALAGTLLLYRVGEFVVKNSVRATAKIIGWGMKGLLAPFDPYDKVEKKIRNHK